MLKNTGFKKEKQKLFKSKGVSISFPFLSFLRYALLGMDMSQADYDGRTALHLGAAEGHEPIIRFLLEKCKVNAHLKDRYLIFL